jgi:uncharacterized membrane protein YcaP (DUF421 family)
MPPRPRGIEGAPLRRTLGVRAERERTVFPDASLVSDLVDLGVPAPEKVVRSLLVFVFLVVALRLAGKRELAQLNVMDLAVLLLVSNALQNAMIGNDNSLLGGIIGASTLFAVNYWFVRLTYRSRAARRVLEGSPRLLLEDGRIDREALRKEAITDLELASIARDRGFERLDDVGLIVLETDGHLAVMGREAAERYRAAR